MRLLTGPCRRGAITTHIILCTGHENSMSIDLQLPEYAEANLAAFSEAELIDVLKRDGDRAPRSVIDECVRRGARMERELETFLANDEAWNAEPDAAQDAWWLRLHAIMILGLIPTQDAGLLLAKALQRTSEDENLADWFSGYWPALFRNKPPDVMPVLESAARQRGMDPYVRAEMMDAMVSMAARDGTEQLDRALASAAAIAADASEDGDLRMLLGCLLLDFPRPQHRVLLSELARGQRRDLGSFFEVDDIDLAYAGMSDKPQWDRFPDPWTFYSPDQIRARQERWQREDASESTGFDSSLIEDFEEELFPEPLPYIRDAPKIGRNDPCPCGSGKKYKKCCLLTEGA